MENPQLHETPNSGLNVFDSLETVPTKNESEPLKQNSKDVPAPLTTTPAPDGGTTAWLIVLAAWLLFAISWGPSLGFGVFQNFYETDLLSAHSPSSIAWIGSVEALLLISTGVIAGPLFDRGYLMPIMIAGCVLVVFGEMMMSLSTQYYQVFLSQGVCVGLGAGIIYVPAVSIINVSFTKKKPIAISAAISGVSIGGIVIPVIFYRLQPRIGFAWTCRTLGFISLAAAIPSLFILAQAPKRHTKPRKLFMLDCFKEAPFDNLAVGSFLDFLAYWIPIFYLPTFAITALDTKPSLAYYMISILNTGSFFGRLAPILFIPKFGAAPVALTANICSAILLFGWIGVQSTAGFIVWSVLFGFFSGTLIGSNPIVVAHPTVSPLSVYGTRWGILSMMAAVGTLVGTPIAGALANPATGSFLNSQAFAGAIMAGGSCFYVWPTVAMMRYNRLAKQNKA